MDVSYRINDLRELLTLIEEATKNIKDYGEEFIPELIDDLKATSNALATELEKIGQSKELDYTSEILKGIYPGSV